MLRSVCDGEGEEDFPRGGQSVLTPLEKRVIREQAMNESLFKEVYISSTILAIYKIYIILYTYIYIIL